MTPRIVTELDGDPVAIGDGTPRLRSLRIPAGAPEEEDLPFRLRLDGGREYLVDELPFQAVAFVGEIERLSVDPPPAAVEVVLDVADAAFADALTIEVDAVGDPGYPDLPLIRSFGFDTLAGGGWFVENRGMPVAPAITTDASAPISPSSVLQMSFPTGFPDGQDPGVAFTGLGGRTEVFVRLTFKASPGWQHHTNNFKHVFFLTNGRRVYSNFTPGGFIGLIHFNDDGMGGTPNIGSTCVSGDCDRGSLPDEAELRDGEWQELAIHGRMNGDGTSDWSWWVDGTLVGTEDNRDLGATTFDEFNIVGTWGGGGSAKVQDDWIRYDHCVIYGE